MALVYNKLNKAGKAGSPVGVILSAVLLLIFVGVSFAIGGDIMQNIRQTQTNQTSGAYVLTGYGLNMSQGAMSFSTVTGVVVGALILLLIAVWLLMTVFTQFQGGGKGGKRFGG